MDLHLYFENAYFIIGTSYAGKSTMVKELAKKHGGIVRKFCQYHLGEKGRIRGENLRGCSSQTYPSRSVLSIVSTGVHGLEACKCGSGSSGRRSYKLFFD